jgi:RNA polymerase sigma-70 factor, ECF subfamily
MDRELLLRARAGDQEAFELIVLAKGESLFRTALAILGNEADARDATQDALIGAWRGLPGLRDPERFDAWLGRSLINQCRTALRRRGRVREINVADWQASSPFGEPAASQADRSREFDEAFARLTVDQRAILVLHHLHGYGVPEIAAWLAVPAGTVKWRLHRARQRLRAELEAD